MTPNPDGNPAKTPAPLLALELGLSVIAGLAAVGFAVVAFRGEHYFMLASQAIALVAAAFGVAAARGRFSDGPALAPACVAGALLAGAVVSGLETRVFSIDGEFRGYATTGEEAAVATLAGLAALFGVLAGLIILARTPVRSGKLLLVGALFGAPVVALAAAWKLGYVARAQEAMPAVAFQVAVLGVSIVVIALVSVAAHCVIRAFEVGVDAADPAAAGGASEKPAA